MTKLLVGVSGGPDSMMLLDKLVKEGYEVVVAHLNYQMRPTAFRDEEIVKDYCTLHNIVLERCYPGLPKGNFQRVAREARYRFFAAMVKKHDCEAVAVAHHLNDLIETYILQCERQSYVKQYGLASEVIIQGVKVIRPLLAYEKSELLDYCDKNSIAYGLDETNYSDKYRRNIIRQDCTKKELEKCLKLIAKDNKWLAAFKTYIKRNKPFAKQKPEIKEYLLYEILNDSGYHYFTARHLKVMGEQLISKGYYRYQSEFILELIDNVLKLTKNRDCNYAYQLTELEYREYPHFKLESAGPKLNGVQVRAEDWPLIVRNWQKGDKIELSYGTKRISRFFIDQKILMSQRISWPVVLNKENKIIMVPGLGPCREFFTEKPNLYVIK